MILICPNCQAQFSVDPHKLGAKGRTVRCAKCKNEWHAQAPLTALAEKPAQEKAKPEDMVRVTAAEDLALRVLEQRKAGVRHGVYAGLAAALLVMVPFFFWRYATISAPVKVVEKSPPQNAAPHKAGADTLQLEGTPSTRLVQEEGRTVLKIDGVLFNAATHALPLPKLVAQAKNAHGEVVKEWTIPLSGEEIQAGQRYPFTFATPFAEQGVVDIAFHFM